MSSGLSAPAAPDGGSARASPSPRRASLLADLAERFAPDDLAALLPDDPSQLTATLQFAETDPERLIAELEAAALRAWLSPAISNAIETFRVRSRATGFMTPDIVCRFPDLPPIVGYAAPTKIRADIPPADDPDALSGLEWHAFIESIPGLNRTGATHVLEPLPAPDVARWAWSPASEETSPPRGRCWGYWARQPWR